VTFTSPAEALSSPAALLSPTDVSRFLGVPCGTLANWRYQGLGPKYLRVGRHVRYRHEDVAAWVESQITGHDRSRFSR
jgi:predicted DNA-binding transcriptional regulator AlpA